MRKSALQLATTAGADAGPHDVAVVVASGSLDIATADQLERAVVDVLEHGSGVLVDVAGLTLCDSSGLGALVRLYRRARAQGQDFAIGNPGKHVADLLAMTGINKVIPIRSRPR